MRSVKWLLRDVAWWAVAVVELVGLLLAHVATSPTLKVAGVVIMLLGVLPMLGPEIEKVREWDRASDPRNKREGPPGAPDDVEP